MALSASLQMRQSQSLVMTPQLLQAIKLLQLSTLELSAYVDAELDRNPLLERVEEAPEIETFEVSSEPQAESEPTAGDWATQELEVSSQAIEDRLGTQLDNVFEDGQVSTRNAVDTNSDGLTVSSSLWSGSGGGSDFDEDERGMDGFATAKPSLAEVLIQQLTIATTDPTERMIGRMLIDLVNESGYLSEPIEGVAERLDANLPDVERVLRLVQTFEPSGVAARDLAECLAIQLRERNRCDPAMQTLLANLDLLARRDFSALQKLCGVDEDDLADMVREIRALDPKPGRAYGTEISAPVVPDVFVRPASNGGWIVELNSDALPRVLLNQAYYARVAKAVKNEQEKVFIQDCFQNANWLTRSLDQRAKTILKVASEIVRQQDAFFLHGVSHLRPLNLKTIADAIGMHESTVSRVTSNKYIATHRGLFEMKYFFTTSITASGGGEAHSAEAVRHRIKQMVDAEEARMILSDDAIVGRLKGMGIEIARRTVAKYRESLRIPSSVERKREKAALAGGY